MRNNRILTMQRQVRTLGRLRTGYTANGKPVRSPNWIITGNERDLLDAAAQEWGGQVREWTPLRSTAKQWSLTTKTNMLPAQLPPGDPLNQANEMWSGGGVVRRCDGETEEKSGQPCLCVARFGDEFFRRPPTDVCRPYSYLKLMLLNLPDIGTWLHVTKSYYAAAEIAGQIDLIRAQVGPDAIVPVWLIIDQRKKVADGKTTPYPVPVIKIRGAESGAALLAGRVPTLELGPGREQIAISAGPAVLTLATARTAGDFAQLAQAAKDADEVRVIWDAASKAEQLNDTLRSTLTSRAQALGAPVKAPANADAAPQAQPSAGAASAPTGRLEAPQAAAAGDVEVAEVEPDVDALWMQITALVGKPPFRWSGPELEKQCYAALGKESTDIDGFDAQRFLDELTAKARQ